MTWAEFLPSSSLSWRRRAKKQLLSRVAVFIVNRSLAAGFTTWRDVATDRGAARQRAAGALAKLQSQRLWASFAAWSAAVQARCNKRMQLAQVLAHWQQASLARAWRVRRLAGGVYGRWPSTFRDLFDRAQPKFVSVGRSCGERAIHTQQSCLFATLQAWREGARAQQAKVAKLLAAARRWHQPLLSSAFLAWAEIVRDRRHLTERLHQAAVHWLHAAQASAFNTWRHQAWKARAARKAAACFAGQTCAKAFRVRPAASLLQRSRLQHSTACVSPGCRPEKSACLAYNSVLFCADRLQSWRAHREHCKILASRLDQAIGRWRSGLSAAAFSGERSGWDVGRGPCCAKDASSGCAEEVRRYPAIQVQASSLAGSPPSLPQPGKQQPSSGATSGKCWPLQLLSCAPVTSPWLSRAGSSMWLTSARGLRSWRLLWAAGGRLHCALPGFPGRSSPCCGGPRSSRWLQHCSCGKGARFGQLGLAGARARQSSVLVGSGCGRLCICGTAAACGQAGHPGARPAPGSVRSRPMLRQLCGCGRTAGCTAPGEHGLLTTLSASGPGPWPHACCTANWRQHLRPGAAKPAGAPGWLARLQRPCSAGTTRPWRLPSLVRGRNHLLEKLCTWGRPGSACAGAPPRFRSVSHPVRELHCVQMPCPPVCSLAR